MMKKYLNRLFGDAVECNHRCILNLLVVDPGSRFVDLGCDDGNLTMKLAAKVGAREVWGVDVIDAQLKNARKRGVKTVRSDLNHHFNLPSRYFDIVHANQVIEHLYDSDNFFGEVMRILKPGGYAVVSTENASSWCNIISSLLGWQIFSLTNISAKKRGIGNPLALHRGDEPELSSWFHIRIYNIRGLVEYAEAFGFIVEKITGAGYFPLPAFIGQLDTTHAHFITLKARKPL